MNRKIGVKTYTGYPASSQLFTMIMIVGIFLSVGLCLVAQQRTVAIWVLIVSIVLSIVFAIVSDRLRKKREARYIEEVMRGESQGK